MAATQGLSHMISDCKKLFQVSLARPWHLTVRIISPDLWTLYQVLNLWVATLLANLYLQNYLHYDS